MLFNLDFASDVILPGFFSFSLFIDLYFLIRTVITQIFNPNAFVIPIEIPTKEVKSEMETHQVTIEITIARDQFNSKVYKLFYASYSSIHFDLFLQLNNFLSHLFFQSKFLIHVFVRHDYIFSDTLAYY